MMLPNIMKKLTSLLTLIFLTMALGAQSATADTEESPKPYYMSIDGGLARLSNRCDNLAAGFTCKDSAPSYALDGGYQLNKYLGLELTFAVYGSPKTSGTVLASNLEVAEETSGFRFSGTLSLPVTDSFALTGRLGYAQTNINVISIVAPGPNIPNYSAATNTLAYGAGLKYSINKTFSLHVKYDNMGEVGDDTTGKHNLSQVSAGLSYNFDVTRPRAAASKNQNNNSTNKPLAQTASPAAQPPVRVIVQLKKSPAANTSELKAAIAQACQCEPYFVRLYNMHALVYQIGLAPEQTFSAFREALLAGDAKLDIKDLTQEP
jgi:opacity protein-like surface antigen